MDDPPKTTLPKRKRRWFQFSLRSLLIFTAVCAIPCGLLGRKIEQKRNERAVVKALVDAGGQVFYDFQHKGISGPAGPDCLKMILGDDFFSDVVEADMHWKPVADAAMKNLKVLTKLEQLNLNGSHVSDAGLENVRELTQLQRLSLNNTAVTDAGMENLKGLTNLQNLDLGYTKVSDVGLESLKGLSQLKALWLRGTNVTDAGVKELQKALPTCSITYP